MIIPRDKRDYTRMKIDSDLNFKVRGENAAKKGFCKDLSHTGISFETDHFLKEEDILEINIDLKSSKYKPLKAEVIVIRVKKKTGKKYIVTGKVLKYL